MSSYISMVARLKLYKKMYEIGFDRIYYCDSDSIACSVENNDKYLSKNLGEWSIEYYI